MKHRFINMKLLGLGGAIFLAVAVAASPSCSPEGYSGPAEPVTVAYSPFEATALFWIAQDQHYFSENGLDLTLRKYDSGAASLTAVLKGEADISVGLSEFPVVRMAFQKEKLAIIGNADRGEFIYLVGRRDRGIASVSDLKGKRIGTAFGTIAQFYLARLLELNGIKTQDVTLVDLKTPAEWVNAVIDGDVDAVVTAQPDAGTVNKRLGANSFFWSVHSGQFVHGLIATSQEWITSHPETAKRFMKSIAQAEEYALLHPAESKAIVQKALNLDAGYMDIVWSQNQFSLSLDQAIIAAMVDEAHWMISNNLTTEKQTPNFVDYIYEDALKAIKPEAVNIIR